VGSNPASPTSIFGGNQPFLTLSEQGPEVQKNLGPVDEGSPAARIGRLPEIIRRESGVVLLGRAVVIMPH
jgi:hypothetical protein